MPSKKNKETTPEEFDVKEDDEPKKAPMPTPAPKATGSPMVLETYFGLRSIKVGHRAGRKAYAYTKHGCDKRTLKTPEEWDGLYKSY